MRVEMIFVTAVLGIAGVHLLSRLVNLLAGFKGAGVQKSSQGKSRDDWYVFFEKSALYGDTVNSSVKSPEVAGEKEVDLVCEDCRRQEVHI